MKVIKTGFGSHKIADCQESDLIIRLGEILTEHRATLIERLSSDLPTYLEYLFNAKLAQRQIEEIKDQLQQLKNSPVHLDKYRSILQLAVTQEVTQVTNEIFYQELNECIESSLRNPKFKPVR